MENQWLTENENEECEVIYPFGRTTEADEAGGDRETDLFLVLHQSFFLLHQSQEHPRSRPRNPLLLFVGFGNARSR